MATVKKLDAGIGVEQKHGLMPVQSVFPAIGCGAFWGGALPLPEKLEVAFRPFVVEVTLNKESQIFGKREVSGFRFRLQTLGEVFGDVAVELGHTNSLFICEVCANQVSTVREEAMSAKQKRSGWGE